MSETLPDPIPDSTRQITQAEADEAREYLCEWRTPNEVRQVLGRIERIAGFYAVSQGSLKFWREAFIGMSCLQLTHARRFRLGGDPPDFELDYGDEIRRFELVNAMPAKWRLSKEYKTYADELSTKGSTTFRRRSYEELKGESESVVQDAEFQIRKKASKNYQERYILVVDIMHDLFLREDSGHARALARVGKKALRSFEEVWFKESTNILRISRQSTSMISAPWPSDD